MDAQQMWLLGGLAAVVFVVVAVVGLVRRRRTHHLSDRFGTEYARVVDEAGGRAKGEAGLVAREKRLEAITIRPLSPADRDRYASAWQTVQAEFLDDPKFSVTHADHLLGEVLSKRGFPIGDFDQRAADLSVDHPVLVNDYRAVHEIAARHALGQATTEDLRQAMILYRALFSEMVEATPPAAATPPTPVPV